MSEIKPALTPEDWERVAEVAGDVARVDTVFDESRHLSDSEEDYCATRHYLAALALHAQPFGFTWKDVDALTNRAELDEETVAIMGGSRTPSKWRDLAARIAALLPPRESG